VLAGTARQTAVLMIPWLVVWILFGKVWTQHSRGQKIAGIFVAIATIAGNYHLTLWVCRDLIGTSSINWVSIAGIFGWMSHDFSIARLVEHTLRCTIPLFLPIAVSVAIIHQMIRAKCVAFRSIPLELWLVFGFAASMIAQPFLGGPHQTNAGGSRLGSIGLVPGALVAVFLMKLFIERSGIPIELNRLDWIALLGACAISSLHHVFAIIGPSSALQTLILQLTMALCLFGLMTKFVSTSTRSNAIVRIGGIRLAGNV
jgi:hypothetical protein